MELGLWPLTDSQHPFMDSIMDRIHCIKSIQKALSAGHTICKVDHVGDKFVEGLFVQQKEGNTVYQHSWYTRGGVYVHGTEAKGRDDVLSVYKIITTLPLAVLAGYLSTDMLWAPEVSTR